MNISFIKPSYEIIQRPDGDPTDVKKFLELIGRVCYKSEGKITDQSCDDFIDMIKRRRHYSILDHYRIVYEVLTPLYNALRDTHDFILENCNPEIDGEDPFKFINMNGPIECADGTRAIVSMPISTINKLVTKIDTVITCFSEYIHCDRHDSITLTKKLNQARKIIAPLLTIFSFFAQRYPDLCMYRIGSIGETPWPVRC